jgi:hypothetical protein
MHVCIRDNSWWSAMQERRRSSTMRRSVPTTFISSPFTLTASTRYCRVHLPLVDLSGVSTDLVACPGVLIFCLLALAPGSLTTRVRLALQLRAVIGCAWSITWCFLARAYHRCHLTKATRNSCCNRFSSLSVIALFGAPPLRNHPIAFSILRAHVVCVCVCVCVRKDAACVGGKRQQK